MKEIWFVEYSPNQKCFHIDLAEDSMKKNILSLFGKYPCDYIPLAICYSHEEAMEASKLLRETFNL